MSRWYLKHLYASFAACVLVLQIFGCQDLGKADNHAARSKHTAQSKQTAQPKQPTPLAEAPQKNETPADALQGACSKTDREDYVHDANQKFIGQLRACSKETWADKAENIACLTKTMPSLSQGCVRCFASMASCALENCKMACMLSAKSDNCIDCANSNCQASLIRCTGVARADLP